MLEVLEEAVRQQADAFPDRNRLRALERDPLQHPRLAIDDDARLAGLEVGEGRVTEGADRNPAALQTPLGVAAQHPLHRPGPVETER